MSLEIGKSKELANEDMDTMITGAGSNLELLLTLQKFYQQMIEIAKPFIQNGRISAPEGRIPIEKLSPQIVETINKMDGAFIETMQYSEWLETFYDGLKAVNKKIAQLESQQSWQEKLK